MADDALPPAVSEAVSVDSLTAYLADGFGDWTPTDIRQAQCLEHFARTLNASESCRVAGVSQSAFDRWKRTDDGFAAVVQRIIDGWVDAAEHTAVRASIDVANVADRHFVLKNLRRTKYAERQTITVVAPEVITRLAKQADAIMQACRMHLDAPTAAMLIPKLAAALDDVWS